MHDINRIINIEVVWTLSKVLTFERRKKNIFKLKLKIPLHSKILTIFIHSLERALLFISDGLPTLGEDPVKVIAEENKDLHNTVTVFTYAIGQGS